MTKRTRLTLIACLLVALVAQPAQAMIRHIFIFEDYEAFRKATFESGIKYTAPAWAKPDQRWLEVVSAFIGYEPEVDFLREKPRLH